MSVRTVKRLQTTSQNGQVKVRDLLMSICCHELKTPLTSMKLQSQLLSFKLEKNDFQKSELERFVLNQNQQINRLTRIINDMFELSRVHNEILSIQKKPTNLSNLFQEVVERQKESLKLAKCSVVLKIAEENIVAVVDSQRIEQILENLLKNVEKYAPGTKVVVSLKKTKDHVRFSVRDFGPGIPAEAQNRIFDCFELYLIKEIVTKHKGKISLISESGYGTKFRIKLPLDIRAKRHSFLSPKNKNE
jgi:signal transduction histidine kinase